MSITQLLLMHVYKYYMKFNSYSIYWCYDSYWFLFIIFFLYTPIVLEINYYRHFGKDFIKYTKLESQDDIVRWMIYIHKDHENRFLNDQLLIESDPEYWRVRDELSKHKLEQNI